MYSETCTPASLPVEDGQDFGTLATLATFAGSQKQDGETGRAALPDAVTGSAGGAGNLPVVRLESESDMVNSLRRLRNCRCITFPSL